MSDQFGQCSFRTLFESALQDYEKQTGIPLANHPLAGKLQNCQSVDTVTTLLQEQVQAFTDFRGSDKIMKSLKSVVSALSKVSAAATIGQDIGMSFTPALAIHTGLGILFTAFNGVSADFDALVDLLESIGHFLKRLDIYTKVPPTRAMTEIVVKIMVEILSTLALVTKQIRQGRPKKFVKKLFGENGVEAVLQRLDRLTQDEARTAAAQTIEVIYGLVQNMRVVIDDGKASADSVRDTLEIIQKMASEINKSKCDKLQQDVRNWLSPPDPWKNHNLALESRQTGTAAWFVGGNTLSEWKSSGPSSLLWIHGKPGAGKSVLCSTIIENIDSLRKSGLASLAFFYCDFREDDKRDLRGLLSSVLIQLCHQSDSYCQILSTFYLEHAKGSRHPSSEALTKCLKNILEVPGQAPVYLIVDGLDECSKTSGMPSPREKVLILLEDLIGSQFPNLRICVTSRPEIDIKVALEPLAFHSVSLHDEDGQIEDIDNYIRSAVTTDAKMRRLKAADRELVIDVLIEKSDGMFRWVYCQIVYLRCCFPGRIRHALDELPETLDETYERALRDIDKANREFVYRLLQCVAVAFRPLRVAELAEILSFDFKTGSVPKFHEVWRLGDPVDAVLSTTSSLLSIVDVKGSRVIQFSHFSVKEFLTSARLAETNDIICRRYHISMTSAHTLAAQACLGLLLHLDKNVGTRDNLIERYPLAEYAAEYWVCHARFEGVSENVEDGMKRLFDPRNPHLAIWVWIYDPLMPPWFQIWQREMPLQLRGSPLHYAAVCGFHAIVKFLVIRHSQDLHSRCIDDDSSPLHLASRQGHEDVARLLLEYGADITAQTKNGETPLHVAMHWQREGDVLALLLLEHSADVTARTKDGTTPLHLASQQGRAEVVHRLLEHGADATAKTDDGITPLYLAVQWECDIISLSLLEHGADATAQTKDGIAPLHLVSQRGREEVARLLLENGADVTARTKEGETPLYLAVQWQHDVVARLLLEHDADVAAQTNDGKTPLHLASREEVARLLLERGADATAQTKDGETPLHMALQWELEDVTRLLLKHGADATAQTKDGGTPLHLAVQWGLEDVIRLLLEHGADVTTQTKDGETPLHLAVLWEFEGVVRLLLEHGADATTQTKDGDTPLHIASQWGREQVARLFVEHGADTTARTKDGTTPLHLASSEEMARFLLEHGADATAQTKDGETPLHMALQWESEGVTRLLLEHGATVTARTKDGETPLHLAVQGERDVVARFLLEHGADPTAQTKDGTTPLHLTSSEEVARLLLENGANATAQTKRWLTSLHLASRCGAEDVVRLLLEHGADATAKTKDGSTPLHLAVRSGHARIVHSLLEHGADATVQRKDGSTLLHLASRWGHVEVASFLFERGVDATAVTKHGWTALHLASRWGHVEVARFLLDHGADAIVRNNYGSTPLRLALHGRHIEVARFLVDHGAYTTGGNEQVATPFRVALQQGNVDIARMLERADAPPFITFALRGVM